MKDEDADWIKDNVTDPIVDTDDEFEGEVWFSTDGKNTVRVKANTKAGRKQALIWGHAVYERLLSTYKTKQALNAKVYANGNGEKKLVCDFCGQPAVEREGVSKAGKPYHGIFCSSEDKNHTKWI